MARVRYPLDVRNSDGKSSIRRSASKTTDNKPTKAQLTGSMKNGVVNRYKELDLNHETSKEWRRKLAGMLARELRQKPGLNEDQKRELSTYARIEERNET